MTLIDFTDPRIVLSVSPFAGNRWIVADQGKLAYYPPCDLDQAVRFMRAMAIQTEGVEIDEESVVAARAVEEMVAEVRAAKSESGESLVGSSAATNLSPVSVEGGPQADAGADGPPVSTADLREPPSPSRHLRLAR